MYLLDQILDCATIDYLIEKPIAFRPSVCTYISKQNYFNVCKDCVAYSFVGSIASDLLKYSIAFGLSV